MGLSAKAEELLMSNQPIFGSWSIETIIGEGSSGTVYEISDNCGNRGALKVISISNDYNDSNSLLAFGSNDDHTEAYIDEMTGDIMDEVKIMHSLCDKKGIVGCKEYGILEAHDEEFTLRLILIRMDLLQSLNKIMRLDETEFTSKTVAKMGVDLCLALTECRKQNIIHRDVKPANIFISSSGEYQLGDFGSAKMLEHTMMASRKGTLAYIAPEVASGQSYNATVDIYSLGIMMYQLLNDLRLPFLDENFKFSDIENAIEKRLSGTPFPPPCNADDRLWQIICKMCAYSPKERYSSPEECITDLEDYISSEKKYHKKLKLPKKLTQCLIFIAAIGIIVPSTVFAVFYIKAKINDSFTAYISSGNVNSSGIVAYDGEWTYFGHGGFGESGYRISANGSKKQILCEQTMYDINLTDQYIVFSAKDPIDTNSDESLINGLYRMEKDRTNLTCLDDGNVLNPVVYGKYVYYMVTEDEVNILRRIPLEGGEIEDLGTYYKYTRHFYPVGKHIYIYIYEKQQLIRTNLDGSEKQTILETDLLSFCIDQGKLYFMQADYNALNQLYVFDLDDISDEVIDIDSDKITSIATPQRVYEFNVADGVIYFSTNLFALFSNDSQSDGIWRVDNDGSNMQKLYSGNATQIQIAGGKIYFYENDIIFSMNADGSNVEKLFDSDGSEYIIIVTT